MALTKIALIGSGGIANVWRVREDDGKEWALKEPQATVRDEKLLARFRQEARIQAALSHPNILPVAAANITGSPPFYVMPIATGNLETEIATFAADRPSFQATAAGIIDGLAHAHVQGILHRDLKPRNIVRVDGRPCIADFGLGKAIDIEASYTTTTSDAWGTYWYASPEQARGLKYCDHRSDIFSLGKLFLHCLAGSRVNELPQDLDSRWKYIIRRCIRDNPDERWQSMSQLKQQFEAVFGIDRPLVVDPAGLIQSLSEIAVAGESAAAGSLNAVLTQIEQIGSDEILARQVFDRLPENLIRAWTAQDEDGLLEFVRRYDDALPQFIDFSYCDTIANQYALVYRLTNNPDLRELIRRRLFTLGPSHNRWHVGGVLAEVVATVRDPAEIVQVINLIESDPSAAQWNREYLKNRASIDQRIRDAIP